MPPFCCCAPILLFDRRPINPAVPVKARLTTARSGGQEPALGLRPEGRPSCWRAAARLALQGRELSRLLDLVTAVQLPLE